MENISWTDRIKSEEGLHRFMDERRTIQTIKRKTASWIDHNFRRSCLLTYIFEGQHKVGENDKEDISSY